MELPENIDKIVKYSKLTPVRGEKAFMISRQSRKATLIKSRRHCVPT